MGKAWKCLSSQSLLLKGFYTVVQAAIKNKLHSYLKYLLLRKCVIICLEDL